MKTASRVTAPAPKQATAQAPTQAQSLPDNRASAVAQRQQQHAIGVSPRVVAQRKQSNRTGLPDQLKAGVENLSGHSLDDVRVHYNSSHPAQLQAHAYAQGTNIHVAPGQEKHLPHEAWHIVQQKQGRVRPTLQLKGIAVNDNSSLEKEADAMGARALAHLPTTVPAQPVALLTSSAAAMSPAQLVRISRDGEEKEHPDGTPLPWGWKVVSTTAPLRTPPPVRETTAPSALGKKTVGASKLEVPTRSEQPSKVVSRETRPPQTRTAPQGLQKSTGRGVVRRGAGRQPDTASRATRTLSTRPEPTASKAPSSTPKRVEEMLPPTVGISNRPGFGYDKSVFEKGPGLSKDKSSAMRPTSLPPGMPELPQKPSAKQEEEVASAVQAARLPEQARAHLDQVNGLFIPGGQDRVEEGSKEKTTREAYEQQLIYEARNRGMPMLAVCGGSRSLARGYGCEEMMLSEKEQERHTAGLSAKAHELRLPEPHSLLGAAAPKTGNGQTRANTISAVNSTHSKVVAHENGKLLKKGVLEERSKPKPEPKPEPKPKSKSKRRRNRRKGGVTASATSAVAPPPPSNDYVDELMISATDGHGNPEGFETRHGAPVMGITSHPEAIHGTNSARNAANADARTWSDNIFKGFAQSTRAYAAKKTMLAELKSKDHRAALKPLEDR